MANEGSTTIATLVDSDVLLDILTDDPVWGGWSAQALTRALDEGPVVVNPIVYAEISVGFDRIEDLDAVVPEPVFAREGLPYAAGFLAGKAFLMYRRAGGSRAAPLPDFYIGAHAAVAGHRLLTRDVPLYRTYFPRVALVAPAEY